MGDGVLAGAGESFGGAASSGLTGVFAVHFDPGRRGHMVASPVGLVTPRGEGNRAAARFARMIRF